MQAVRRDGTTVAVQLSLSVPPGSPPTGFCAVIRDDSRAHTAGQARERLWRHTFDDAPIGMAVAAPDGCFVRANRALLDRSDAQLLGLLVSAITHAEDLDASDAAFARLRSGAGAGASVQGVQRYVRPDQQVRWVRRTMSAMPEYGGTDTSYLLQVQDVTVEHEASEALTRLAYTDLLTGLGNREQLRLTADARAAGCGLLLLDLHPSATSV